MLKLDAERDNNSGSKSFLKHLNELRFRKMKIKANKLINFHQGFI